MPLPILVQAAVMLLLSDTTNMLQRIWSHPPSQELHNKCICGDCNAKTSEGGKEYGED